MVGDYSQYVSGRILNSNKLSDLGSMVKDLYEEERNIERIERELAEAKDRARTLSEVLIPDLMTEIGLEKVKTKDGLEVSVKSTVRASVPSDRREAAYDWLDSHGHGALVRREVSVAFRKEQESAARELLDALRGQFPDAREQRFVHHSTLAAWVREQLRKGKQLPTDLFGIYEQRKTKIRSLTK